MKSVKESLRDICIAQQTKVIEQLQNEISEAQRQSNEYGQPKDRYDAYKTKLMRQIELFSGQLSKATVVLNTLRQIPIEKKFEEVEFGAMVTTNRQKLFVAASIGKVDLDGETWFAISPNVPIFKALQGKKQGESAVFNGMDIEIKSID